nr:glutamate receptor ionotropic, kainate 5-like [Dermatophagoides farinae]
MSLHSYFRYHHWSCMMMICLLVMIILPNKHERLILAKPSNLLKGVIIRNWPYADQFGQQYTGFAVDLLDLIAERLGFEYCLHQPNDGKYGSVNPDGTVTGMIGEVYTNEADFATGDLEVTESRRKYVDFTEPFIENQLSAIIRRDLNSELLSQSNQQNRTKYMSLQDLVQANNEIKTTDPQQQQSNGPIIFGVVRNSAIFDYLSRSQNPTARQIYESIMNNQDKSSLVNTANEGVDHVYRNPRYAFLVESTFAEDVIGQNCNLTMIMDRQSMYPRNFAIALVRGSPYLERFNQAIRELKARGQVELLRQKYWTKFCDKQGQIRDADIGIRLPSPPSSPPQSPPWNDPYRYQRPRWPQPSPGYESRQYVYPYGVGDARYSQQPVTLQGDGQPQSPYPQQNYPGSS